APVERPARVGAIRRGQGHEALDEEVLEGLGPAALVLTARRPEVEGLRRALAGAGGPQGRGRRLIDALTGQDDAVGLARLLAREEARRKVRQDGGGRARESIAVAASARS